jgi:hypothetical protein
LQGKVLRKFRQACGSELAVELGLGVAEVCAGAAVGAVGPSLAGKAVVVRCAIQIVIPVAADDDVIPSVSHEGIDVVSTIDQIRPLLAVPEVAIDPGRAGEELVVAGPSPEQVGVPLAIEAIAGPVAIELVRSITPVKAVHSCATGQDVISRSSNDRIVAGARSPGGRGEDQSSGQDKRKRQERQTTASHGFLLCEVAEKKLAQAGGRI